MKLEFVCLANSYKEGGRCIAGLLSDGGGWIRPVADTEHGELYREHYRLRDGSEPELLDLIALRVREQRPEPHQPENWLIVDKPWRRVTRGSPLDLDSILRAQVHDGSPLFGNSGDRVPFSEFEANPAGYSLALLEVESIEWLAAPKFFGGTQARARFEWAGLTYDLVVTDPIMRSRVLELGLGSHTSKDVGFKGEEQFYLTISLGEPFVKTGDCYKLVAAVIPFSRLPNVDMERQRGE